MSVTITTTGKPTDSERVEAAKITAAIRSQSQARAGGLNPPSQAQDSAPGARAFSVEPDNPQSQAPKAPKAEGEASGDNSPISVKSSERKIQGINTVERNELISTTGREFGPDIALKVGPKIVGNEISGKEASGEKIKDIINENSSITEVLNILAFLLNNDEQIKRSVITEFSYDHDGIFDKLYASFKDNAPPLFDIETLKTLKPSESSASVASAETKSTVSITIPGTILKRDERCELKNDIILNSEQIQPLISACILQMVNILENTRQVFGGWAKLFKGMQGGSNSKSKTKTRRNNRRRH